MIVIISLKTWIPTLNISLVYISVNHMNIVSIKLSKNPTIHNIVQVSVNKIKFKIILVTSLKSVLH